MLHLKKKKLDQAETGKTTFATILSLKYICKTSESITYQEYITKYYKLKRKIKLVSVYLFGPQINSILASGLCIF